MIATIASNVIARRVQVYVVGGLVDRSVKKQASLSRAAALGARCVRLPLQEYAPGVNNARLPLTLCAVLELSLIHI